MGVVLILVIVVLAFLCGRLQVTVNVLKKRMESLELSMASIERLAKLFDEKE